MGCRPLFKCLRMRFTSSTFPLPYLESLISHHFPVQDGSLLQSSLPVQHFEEEDAHCSSFRSLKSSPLCYDILLPLLGMMITAGLLSYFIILFLGMHNFRLFLPCDIRPQSALYLVSSLINISDPGIITHSSKFYMVCYAGLCKPPLFIMPFQLSYALHSCVHHFGQLCFYSVTAHFNRRFHFTRFYDPFLLALISLYSFISCFAPCLFLSCYYCWHADTQKLCWGDWRRHTTTSGHQNYVAFGENFPTEHYVVLFVHYIHQKFSRWAFTSSGGFRLEGSQGAWCTCLQYANTWSDRTAVSSMIEVSRVNTAVCSPSLDTSFIPGFDASNQGRNGTHVAFCLYTGPNIWGVCPHIASCRHALTQPIFAIWVDWDFTYININSSLE